jgi:hypothetical protein
MNMLKNLLRNLRYFIAGLIVWIRLGIPFLEAMQSAREAERITREFENK